MGIRKYKQEYCCEFVETESSVFAYNEIERMFADQEEEKAEEEVIETSGVDYSILEA